MSNFYDPDALPIHKAYKRDKKRARVVGVVLGFVLGFVSSMTIAHVNGLNWLMAE